MKGLCAPTIIAIFLGLLSIIGSIMAVFHSNKTLRQSDKMSLEVQKTRSQAIRTAVSNIIFNVLFVAVLFVLCYYGHKTVAWVLLLLPIILGILLIFMVINATGTLIKGLEEGFKDKKHVTN